MTAAYIVRRFTFALMACGLLAGCATQQAGAPYAVEGTDLQAYGDPYPPGAAYGPYDPDYVYDPGYYAPGYGYGYAPYTGIGFSSLSFGYFGGTSRSHGHKSHRHSKGRDFSHSRRSSKDRRDNRKIRSGKRLNEGRAARREARSNGQTELQRARSQERRDAKRAARVAARKQANTAVPASTRLTESRRAKARGNRARGGSRRNSQRSRR